MRVQSADLVVNTNGKGTYEITDEIQSEIDQSGVRNGTVTVFVQHASCSLIAMENAAPRDLERFFDKLVPEDQEFEHDDEGPDDMRFATCPHGADSDERDHSDCRWKNAAR